MGSKNIDTELLLKLFSTLTDGLMSMEKVVSDLVNKVDNYPTKEVVLQTFELFELKLKDNFKEIFNSYKNDISNDLKMTLENSILKIERVVDGSEEKKELLNIELKEKEKERKGKLKVSVLKIIGAAIVAGLTLLIKHLLGTKP